MALWSRGGRSLPGAKRRWRGTPVTAHIEAPEEAFDEFEADLIGQVYEKYGPLPGMASSQLTHASRGPWFGTGREKTRSSRMN